MTYISVVAPDLNERLDATARREAAKEILLPYSFRWFPAIQVETLEGTIYHTAQQCPPSLACKCINISVQKRRS